MFTKNYLVTYVYKCNDGSWGFGNKTLKWTKKLDDCSFEYFGNQIIYLNNRVLIQRKTHYKEVVIINIVKL